MIGLRNWELLFLIFVVAGFVRWLHPELSTKAGYSGWWHPRKLAMATARIVVWFLIVGNTMLKVSDQPTAQEAGRNLMLYIGAGCLTWILFRLPVIFRTMWQLMMK
jgi:hypothetical protein